MRLQEVCDRLREFLRPEARGGSVVLHEPKFTEEQAQAVARTVREGWVSYLGPQVAEFEQALARFTGRKHALAVVNGTAGLHLSLVLAGVHPGDEVLIPPLSFAATASAVVQAGAVPHFVDIEPVSLGMCPASLERRLAKVGVRDGEALVNGITGRRIAAVVPVHVFGHPARTPELAALCAEYGLPMVEDAAEALGSYRSGAHVGGDGLWAVLSFNGNKVLTTGGGGALLTDDDALAARARHLSTTAKIPHPWEFEHDEAGLNYRMPALNAALGLAQMSGLPEILERKRRLAAAYQELFADVPGVGVLAEPPGTTGNYWLNALLLEPETAPLRDDLLRTCLDMGISCRPAWKLLSDLQPYVRSPGAELPVARDLQPRLVCLPSSPCLAP